MANSVACGTGRDWARRPEDWRQGVHQLVRALAEHVVGGDPELRLHGLLELRLARLLGATRARVVPVRHAAPAAGAGDTLARAVIPGPPHGQALTLEVDLGDRVPDPWDRQVLETAAHLAALALAADRGRVPRLPARVSTGAAPLIGSSAAMRALRDRIERVAVTDFTVLIEGESGTGKELVARQIHDFSRRRTGPFVAVNCAALVETLLEAELFGIEERTATGVRGRRGKFEHADGGTLFLDEVSDLSLAAQAKLLRAIQDLGGRARRRPRHAAASTCGSSPPPTGRWPMLVERGALSRRPVLPPERCRPARAAAAPAARRRPGAGALLPGTATTTGSA